MYIGSDGSGRNVRCYCNLPACVTTGYMCKSNSGCYSELVQDPRRARHGCVDEDPTIDLSSKCMNTPGKGSGPWGASLLLCCNSDMCNHVDNPTARFRINDSLPGSLTTNLIGFNNHQSHPGGHAPGNLDSSAENWFRAATIFVPICGALILFVLIAFAIKLLRTDSLDASNKLSAAYIHHVPNQRSLDQPLMKKSPIIRTSCDHIPPVHVPLLLSHSNPVHVLNERHNIGTSSSKNESYIIMQHPQRNGAFPSSQTVKLTDSNRDVNVNVETSPKNEDSLNSSNSKLYDKQFINCDDKLYNTETILNWGQSSTKINR